MLLVFGILAVLIGLLLPAVQNVRQTARRMEDSTRLREINFACMQVADLNGGKLPAFSGSRNGPQLPIENAPLPAVSIYLWRTARQPTGTDPRKEGYQDRFFQSPSDPSFTATVLNSEFGQPMTNTNGHVSYQGERISNG